MELRQFRYFVAVVDSGSYAGAAEACHITQPAISASISLLEGEVGAPILERGAFGARPTEIGKVLYQHARLILAELERARSHLEMTRKGDSGTVVIGVSPMTECAFAPTVIAEFVRRRPQAQVTVITALSGELFQRLALGELDLVFNSPPRDLEFPDTLETEVLATSGDIVIASNSHPICAQTRPPLRSLSDFRWIVTARSAHTNSRFYGAFNAADAPRPRETIRMDSFPTVMRLVDELGYLFVITPLVLPYLRSLVSDPSRIKAISIPELAFPRDVCIATRRGSILGALSHEMICLIRDHVDQMAQRSAKTAG